VFHVAVNRADSSLADVYTAILSARKAVVAHKYTPDSWTVLGILRLNNARDEVKVACTRGIATTMTLNWSARHDVKI
jgi:hypothetical protein